MTRKLSVPLLALCLTACSAEVEIISDPVSAAIPVTSLQSPVYAEIAIDIPPEAQGALEDIEIDLLTVTGQVVNPSEATGMNLGLRLSFEGTAEPGALYAFTELTKPAYFARSTELLPVARYDPATTTPFLIDRGPLTQIPRQKRIWLIVSNTITSVGFGELLPQEIQLNNVQVRALLTKSFNDLGGAQELSGL